ncbi:small, acid-soluble spore protein, alpha/beta type [Clostridiaceae bacterium UIB06]|uniref:Small, acid-soluble spore protein, alpha/beta type n=1 Tax=Clostridium thailandense TaxID=2794346 RepID=A0A949TUS7_9CLOT|nr:small, acid-soluble spore protein, alpha/beta type [Clostridium thailandense]MBV7271810.1 small, acid-soluble spore protein, alpha/beta type [Clostridium thailandense]MCH5135606.1 small, acid-soluble spore protein, alpha/beta type [Clostridiaceae bacterium UIB06]
MKINIYEAKDGLNKTKVDTAMQINTSNSAYTENLTSKENTSFVKRMVEEYELSLLGK